MDSTRQRVSGTGALLNANRDTLEQGYFRVGIDSVAIFETNVIQTSATATALTVFTGITVAITAFCIANPKACFGSCPTFYISDGDSLHPDAEGFSASIAPSLEASDIDALFHASARDGEFIIEMKNEALETHVVRYVDLLAVPRSKGHRVFADSKGNFWESSFILSPYTGLDYELFLQSQGYYLEWIRQVWIKEENPALLVELWLNPEALLKRLAPEFKKVEKEIENCFWNSRYEKHN